MSDIPSMKCFDPATDGPVAFFKIFSSAVAPRPIAFVSTVAADGTKNLSPFSFFNFFSANPPVLVFSVSTPASGGEKDTLRNVRESGECIVHITDRPLGDQLNLASAVYAPDVDEFEKSGLTAVAGEAVNAFRVAEAKIAMECRLRQIVPLGDQRASGNLVICDVVKLHADEAILFEDGASIDPRKFASLSRLGGEWYMETRPDALFELPRPPGGDAMGVKGVLAAAPLASQLSLAERAILGTSSAPPDGTAVAAFAERWRASRANEEPTRQEVALLDHARKSLSEHKVDEGWLAILAAEQLSVPKELHR
ncbi:flavin reductase family protein [Henriciella pelagia]|jgi:flavin reductase (DIM6/NTAB) family NADH-FMN oxidoreductase RutF|uniref:Flavin reductase n=3 Tax=Henriciella pelagia TaxID=1977912 RepID=A0ABQ1JFK1_9PROT|nr:flavin reductase family protein [Henriciella pelagia]GGB65062.1 flavin reductase [Henriciella pelagia]